MQAYIRLFSIIAAALAASFGLSAQTYDANTSGIMREASRLHADYRFDKAESLYRKALENITDSVSRQYVMDRILECQNGKNLLQIIVRPVSVAEKDSPVEDFFLNIPEFQDGSWKPVPNPFVKPAEKHRNPYYHGVYFPDGSDRIIFSAPDENGIWNIYTSYKKDSTWSVPEFLSENILSGKNDIFPIISADGKRLYFASDGMAGMGGYDLFCSRWDESINDWGLPENMGFPYSSTADDIFYYDTPDGRFSIFASNRSTSADSVRIYVTEAITTPIRTPIKDNESAKDLAELGISVQKEATMPESGQEKKGNGTVTGTEISEYSSLVKNLRNLQVQHSDKVRKIEESRRIYERSSGEDKEFMAGIIRDLETELLKIQQDIDNLSVQIRKTETEFLAKGIIPAFEDTAEEQVIPDNAQEKHAEYKFAKREMGAMPFTIIETPKPKFDYSFSIDRNKPGKFAEDNTLPDRLVYQIQFMVLTTHAKIKDIKGMSPVFVTRLKSGKYLHTVGLFYTYSEALSHLGQVKKNGFPQAFIVAYDSGKSLSVKQARTLENTRAKATPGNSYRVIVRGYDTLPEEFITGIRGACDKDISKASDEQGIYYIVGPFSDKSDAQLVISVLKNSGAKDVSLDNFK